MLCEAAANVYVDAVTGEALENRFLIVKSISRCTTKNSRSQEFRLCGYEQTGNDSCNIVLKHTSNWDQTGFVFVDPTTGQIVKEIR